MAMPNFQEIMLPLLKLHANGEIHYLKGLVESLEQIFALTDDEKQQRVPSGTQRKIYNNTTWARTYLGRAGLLERRLKSGSVITEEGKKLLVQNPASINVKMLRAYPSFREFEGREKQTTDSEQPVVLEDTNKTPQEIMGILSEQLNLELAKELLDEICGNTPTFFERLVIDLLLKMGYGGLEGWGELTKKTGDGGIDGIIKQDELGLDMIYIQAKRWDKNHAVPRPDIQKFAGALLGEGATKGVFMTTAGFTKAAVEYANSVPNAKIILIDGLTLANLMIKHDLGVSTINTIRIKKRDSDYFDEQ
ncbi:MAG: restriction endonuclease [Defluviitaleaceae bacterium]|nr:restriction endonuclease [Defluviitaleaceae bacterium]